MVHGSHPCGRVPAVTTRAPAVADAAYVADIRAPELFVMVVETTPHLHGVDSRVDHASSFGNGKRRHMGVANSDTSVLEPAIILTGYTATVLSIDAPPSSDRSVSSLSSRSPRDPFHSFVKCPIHHLLHFRCPLLYFSSSSDVNRLRPVEVSTYNCYSSLLAGNRLVGFFKLRRVKLGGQAGLRSLITKTFSSLLLLRPRGLRARACH